MPSFGRLGKHSNRSSQALASSKTPATTTTPSATSGSAATGAPAATTQVTGHQRQPSHQQQQQQQQLLDEADSAAHSAHSGHGFGHSHNANANASNPANSSATPHSALSSSHNTAYSSSESFDSRQPSHLLQQQHQHQGQQPLHLQHPQQQHQPQTPLLPSPSSASAGGAPPPPHLYSSPSAASSTTGANINNPPSLQQQQSSNLSGFDGHQSHSDFVDPGLGRSQSIRYSSATPYDIATSSVDDLNSHAAGYGQAPPPPAQQLQPPQQQQQQQPQATPQKLSTRKLIKGIFSGSNRGASDSQHHHGISIGHGHHHSYDNTGGLARRPSKRTRSNPLFPPQPNSPKPNQPQLVNPGYHWRQPPSHPLPPPAQAEQIQQVQQVPDNPQSPYPPQLSSRQGLDDINEHYSAHDSNSHSPSQNSRISLHNTIRQVSGEVDQQQHSANYEDVAYRQNQAPPQQQQQPPPQPHVQVHPQDQQPQTIYETSVYDQQPSPLNPPQHPSQQPYPYPNSQQPGYHQGGIQGGDLRTVPAHLGTVSQFQNPETVSQFSHESPITDSDQRSANLQSASTSPAVNHSVYIQNHGSTTSLPPAQQITPQPQQSGMAPPAGGPPPSRRPEADKLRGQVDPPAGPPPTYRHSTSMNNMNPLPPVPQGVGQPQAYQGNRPPQFEGEGRDSPQPVSAVPAEPAGDDKSFKDLLTKYKNVKRLYFDGKAQIDALTGQIVHLQNAVANQRMSQSRTALDDNEYSTRWNRLNGAINNLSFNIRKDWRSVPQWLVSYVSADALKTGKAEMTAVGRAVISRWLMEEVFNKCFHPGLDPQLSQSLKEIELNIRHNAYTMTSQEEFDALTNKVVNWRMTTLEGLHRQLNSPSTADNRTAFTAKATSTLTACLYQFLNNPPPAGVEGSTSMIVELAVGIAANLPLESRDVAITYPLPGEIVQPRVMEVEKAPLPPLEGQKEDGEDDDKKKEEGDDKSGKAKTVAVPSDANRVRFAGFMALEVRGRQVLWKAPIWTL